MASKFTDTENNADRAPNRKNFLAFFRGTYSPWLIFLLSLSVTYIAWSLTNKSHQRHTQDLFTFEVAQTLQAIEQRMRGYEQVLRGGIGLFKASTHVSRQEFHDYVSKLEVDKRWPGIQGIGYAVMLKPKEKDIFVNALRLEGFNEFNVFPAGLREQYSSILYLEPFTARNQRAFGYDMYSEKSRHIAMDIARDNGNVALSAKVKLVQESDHDLQNGFLMYLPLYQNGAAIENIAQRQKELIGYVYSPFRMDDLIEGILLSAKNYQINFSIYDGDSQAIEDLLYSPKIKPDSVSNPDIKAFTPRFSVVKTIEFPGRNWTLHFRSTYVFESILKNNLATLIGFTGTTLSVLLLFVLLNIARSSTKAREASAESKVLIDRLKAGASAGIVGIYDWDVKNNILNWDSVMYRLYDIDKSNVENLQQAWFSRIHIDDQAYVDGEIQAALRNEREYSLEFRVLWPDNSVHYIKAVSKTSFDHAGRAIRIVGVNYDITEQKNLQIRLNKQASYDQLTQLPNRRLINDRLKQAIAFTDRNEKNMAILFIDLDDFKQINDSYGHHVGDWLLIEVSNRIQACLRTTDTVGRLGGDEFVVILPTIYQHAEDVANKIRITLENDFVMDNDELLNISSSIGVAIYPQHATEQALLMECADKAMYEAKKRGRNKVMIFGNF
ncbi:GGDEF domain-containing protein [Colwellia sp. MB02u-18]|uniref:CHASE domain-containing protein n=1 Tax=unclassified Colwellia TaxID=196834 RepID=UPI0015F74C69|nr:MULTISPECIES: GGDEF domain-containing protein [unclassified Colwellia]MBA6223633.1 GGDEF domain-containing protein [Colwellia sp. MB3u-45]MBA6267301.1 GGDEF domain-containing protein [Colwellia sp. MB3u-43]MBA6319814.1 GGDEF domain-containing protein [Colwellia sp. MB02u-19]MBA6323807.1 GGDEF domain-containing protein [Colwellia sp. MB02u-18]MBA6330797.1 GGDEF domain-containing protein [Colwellia sp. MB02u-12]